MKPHNGPIMNWSKRTCAGGLGYYIWGRILAHPDFDDQVTNTSIVVAHDVATGEIETLNSRYTLVGAEQHG